MFEKAIWRCSLSVRVASWALGLAVLPLAHAAHSAPSPEPSAIANRIWEKLLTRCGESYFYAGSVFDGAGMLSNVQVSHQKTMEYRGVRFHTVPMRVTDAERANGLGYRARITMIAHLFREEDEPWQDGLDLQPRNTDDIMGQAIKQVGSDMFDLGNAGAIALQIVKIKGKWLVERSSATSSSELGFGSTFYDLDKVLAARVPRYSCATAQTIYPGPTAEEEAARKARLSKFDAEMQAFRVEQDQKAQVKAAGLARWEFRGSVDAFRDALIDNLNRRAAEFNVDPSSYAPEVDRIMREVQTCVGVTGDEWHEAMSSTDTRNQVAVLHSCEFVDFGGRFGINISPNGRARAIQIDRHVAEEKDTHLVLADDFTLNVYFDKVSDDPQLPYEEEFGRYIIISAHIPRLHTEVAQGQPSGSGATPN